MLHVKFCIFLSIYNRSVLHLFEQTSFLTRKSLCGFSLYFRVTTSMIILTMKRESTCNMENALLYWLAPFETLCHLASDIEHCSWHSVVVTNLNIPRDFSCSREASVMPCFYAIFWKYWGRLLACIHILHKFYHHIYMITSKLCKIITLKFFPFNFRINTLHILTSFSAFTVICDLYGDEMFYLISYQTESVLFSFKMHLGRYVFQFSMFLLAQFL